MKVVYTIVVTGVLSPAHHHPHILRATVRTLQTDPLTTIVAVEAIKPDAKDRPAGAAASYSLPVLDG